MERPDLFVPLSVKAPRNPAIRTAGPLAELLFYRGLMYAKENGNVGWIPAFDIEVVAVGLLEVPASIKALMDEELWTAGDGGWHIPSWDAWNNTDQATVAREQKKRSDAARRQAAKRERDKIAAGQVPIVPVVAVPEPAQDTPSDSSNVTGDITRESRVTVTPVTHLEREEEIERDKDVSALRAGVQPPLLDLPDSPTPPAPGRAKGKTKEPKPNPHAVADKIAADWWEKRDKSTTTQTFIAVRSLIRPIIAQGVDADQLAAAMDSATRDGFALSQGSLTTAMNKNQRAQQVSPYGSNVVALTSRSPATRKAGAAFERAARYAAEDAAAAAAENDPFADVWEA